MDNSLKGIEAKLAELVNKRNAARRDNRPELTTRQIDAQRESEPTDDQVRVLRQFKVPESDITAMSKYDATEALDKIFEEIRRRDALPISKKLSEALVKWGFELGDMKLLTQGEGRALLRKVAPPMKRDPNATYVSKNPLWKTAIKKKTAAK